MEQPTGRQTADKGTRRKGDTEIGDKQPGEEMAIQHFQTKNAAPFPKQHLPFNYISLKTKDQLPHASQASGLSSEQAIWA
jgi:hypothetical protein